MKLSERQEVRLQNQRDRAGRHAGPPTVRPEPGPGRHAGPYRPRHARRDVIQLLEVARAGG